MGLWYTGWTKFPSEDVSLKLPPRGGGCPVSTWYGGGGGGYSSSIIGSWVKLARIRLLGRLLSEPWVERVGSGEDDESARLPLVEGLPSDWTRLFGLGKESSNKSRDWHQYHHRFHGSEDDSDNDDDNDNDDDDDDDSDNDSSDDGEVNIVYTMMAVFAQITFYILQCDNLNAPYMMWTFIFMCSASFSVSSFRFNTQT